MGVDGRNSMERVFVFAMVMRMVMMVQATMVIMVHEAVVKISNN